MVEQKKPKRKRKRKKPRIWVEWICGKCHKVHRLSFPYSLQPLRRGEVLRVKWGATKPRSLNIDYGATLTQINEFLNSLFTEEFEAKEYVKIGYPQSLLNKLEKNEEIAQKAKNLHEVS